MATTDTRHLKRCQYLLRGQVQGVGLRPAVYRIATRLGFTGTVKNTASGVVIEVQGDDPCLFLAELRHYLPPLARLDHVQSLPLPIDASERVFSILASSLSPGTHSYIPPDTALCKACLEELVNPNSHYYQYPFINCTECGPRFSITEQLPYDRCQTSMAVFPWCTACADDYANPNNRRYHAEPIACAQCGPHLSEDIQAIAQAIQSGQIVAIKGLGGYQLWVDPSQASAVERLRTRKQRSAKPFALMVQDLATARQIAFMCQEEEQQLISPARPIVLVRRRQGPIKVADNVAPGLAHWGLMLPSTPVHHLLFQALPRESVLLVTSANVAGLPLIYQAVEAECKLSKIADHIVHYNRAIITPVDDSVLRMVAGKTLFIRRARGYVPEPIVLSEDLPCTLALGGHLKNTFCLTRGKEAFVSQHIGNLTQAATIQSLHACLNHWQRLLGVTPERIVCDLHPDFYTTQLSYQYALPVIRIQHHYAHLAAVMAEHHLTDPVIGLALDGYGYGEEGEAWGGELFLMQNHACQRIGHLCPLPMVGGELVVRQPWRMAAAVLHQLNRPSLISQRFAQQPHVKAIEQLLAQSRNFPVTTSAGRWFDAASALLNVCPVSEYEGHAAALLESQVTELMMMPKGWKLHGNQLDLLPVFEALLDCDPAEGANLFHGTLIAALVDWVDVAARQYGIKTIVLGGGCFVNQVLLNGLNQALSLLGFEVHWSHRVPVNDGGLALGQAWASADG